MPIEQIHCRGKARVFATGLVQTVVGDSQDIRKCDIAKCVSAGPTDSPRHVRDAVVDDPVDDAGMMSSRYLSRSVLMSRMTTSA